MDQQQREETKRQRYQLVNEIMPALGDPPAEHTVLWWQYYYAIKMLGPEAVREIASEALAKQAAGGMKNGEGVQRSTGGIFFALVRERFRTIFDKERARREPYAAARWKYGKQEMLRRFLPLLSPDWPAST